MSFKQVIKDKILNPDQLSGPKWFLHEATGYSVLRDVIRAARPETSCLSGRLSALSVLREDIKTMLAAARRLFSTKTPGRCETFDEAVAHDVLRAVLDEIAAIDVDPARPRVVSDPKNIAARKELRDASRRSNEKPLRISVNAAYARP